MIEDHWDTRQEYIKQGNELAALEQKQEREKQEQEKAMKEMQERMTTVAAQPNNYAGGGGGDLMPVYVPQKQETSAPNPQNVPNMPPQGMNGVGGMRPLENRGRMGFQNNMPSSSMQMPSGQNRNPFQGNGGRF